MELANIVRPVTILAARKYTYKQCVIIPSAFEQKWGYQIDRNETVAPTNYDAGGKEKENVMHIIQRLKQNRTLSNQ